MQSEALVKRLSYMYPFVYEIGGKCYFIGITVFRECTPEEREAYGRYKAELAKYAAIDKYDVPKALADLAAAVEALMHADNCEYDCRRSGRARRDLEALLEHQPEETLAALNAQIEDLAKALELIDRYQIKYVIGSKLK